MITRVRNKGPEVEHRKSLQLHTHPHPPCPGCRHVSQRGAASISIQGRTHSDHLSRNPAFGEALSAFPGDLTWTQWARVLGPQADVSCRRGTGFSPEHVQLSPDSFHSRPELGGLTASGEEDVWLRKRGRGDPNPWLLAGQMRWFARSPEEQGLCRWRLRLDSGCAPAVAWLLRLALGLTWPRAPGCPARSLGSHC